MQLLDVLCHQGEPRTEYFVELPTDYGRLRLDLTAEVGVALTHTGTTDAMREMADQDIAAALQRAVQEPQAAEQGLLRVIADYPFYARTYSELAEFYMGTGQLAEAEYQLKQLIALQSSYENLSGLAQLLGRRQRYPEALLLDQYLWDQRATAPAAAALQVARDYLVTLTRVQDGKSMITLAETAMQEYGATTVFYYQYLLGYFLDQQIAMAKTKLDAVLPQLDPGDPLYPRFEQMEQLLNAQLQGQ